jgi:hypothetical protein
MINSSFVCTFNRECSKVFIIIDHKLNYIIALLYLHRFHFELSIFHLFEFHEIFSMLSLKIDSHAAFSCLLALIKAFNEHTFYFMNITIYEIFFGEIENH